MSPWFSVCGISRLLGLVDAQYTPIYDKEVGDSTGRMFWVRMVRCFPCANDWKEVFSRVRPFAALARCGLGRPLAAGSAEARDVVLHLASRPESSTPHFSELMMTSSTACVYERAMLCRVSDASHDQPLLCFDCETLTAPDWSLRLMTALRTS